jgi:hypothetical protein
VAVVRSFQSAVVLFQALSDAPSVYSSTSARADREPASRARLAAAAANTTVDLFFAVEKQEADDVFRPMRFLTCIFKSSN